MQTSTGIVGEIAWNGLRLVVAHDPVIALEQQVKRRAKMAELEDLANQPGQRAHGKPVGRLKVGRLYGKTFTTKREGMDEVIDWLTF